MNPFSRRLWASAWYLLAYVGLGTALFCVAFTAATTAAALGWTLVGLPLMIAAAAAIRGCANVERFRTGRFLGEPVTGRYREVTRPGIWAQVKTRWKDPATWRDTAYLVGMFLPLFVLDLTVFAVWLVLLAGITVPVWYRYPNQTFGHGQVAHGVQLGYFPNGPHGSPGYGLYIDSLPRALIAAAVCLIGFLLFSRVLVLTARVHATVARTLLRNPPDPLAEAREVLSRPGPLPSLLPNERVLYAPPARVQLAGGDRTTLHTDYPREATMRQSQCSVLPETKDKRKRPAGVGWPTALMGLAGVAVVVAAVAMMAIAGPQRVAAHQAQLPAAQVPAAQIPAAQVPAHSSAPVQERAS